MAAAALPGLFFCFAAAALLIIATVSAPIWDSVSFLNADFGGQHYAFGTFGYSPGPTKYGYSLDSADIGFEGENPWKSAVLRNLTYVLILHPIAAGLALLAVIFGLCGSANSRFGTIFMTIASSLAAVLTFIVFIIDMVLWGVLRNHIRDNGGSAQYGNANWMVLGALVALLLAFCTSFCGIFGRYNSRYRTRGKV